MCLEMMQAYESLMKAFTDRNKVKFLFHPATNGLFSSPIILTLHSFFSLATFRMGYAQTRGLYPLLSLYQPSPLYQQRMKTGEGTVEARGGMVNMIFVPGRLSFLC